MSKKLCRWMQPGLFLALSLFVLPGHSAGNNSLPPPVQQALTAGKLGNQSFAMVTLPMDGTGKARLFNADKAMNPASAMKIVTTYAALELLGPTHQWRTEFYTDGKLSGSGVLSGNLYLKGGGDPKLNLERLWLMLRELKANGVQQVTGDLVLDRSHFVHPELPLFNDDGGDPLRPFLVEPDALLINLKAVRLLVRNTGGKISLNMDPPLATVQMVNQVEPQPASRSGSPSPNVRFHLQQKDNGVSLVVSGKLAEGGRAVFYLSLLDHPTYAAGAVRAIWQELGGRIDGQNRLGELPENAKLLSRTFSPDLVEIIRDINKYSNNTMARQLYLSLGAQFRTPGDENDGKAAERVIRAWLKKKGIKINHLVLENGSGLSRNERISARELAAILQAAWKSPFAAEFISSLPLAAMDGTLRKRLRGTALVGQAHLKTGALNNARTIAGFSRDRNGNNWVVVAMVNDPKPWNAATVLDSVLVDLYRQPKPATKAKR